MNTETKHIVFNFDYTEKNLLGLLSGSGFSND